MAFSRACADYAAGACLPALSDSAIGELDVAQGEACRTITGCVRSTPAAALEREADLQPFHIRKRLLAAIAVEKHSRDLPDDPIQRVLAPDARSRKRLKRDRGWADKGIDTCTEAGLQNYPREPRLVFPSNALWQPKPELVSILDPGPAWIGRSPGTPPQNQGRRRRKRRFADYHQPK